MAILVIIQRGTMMRIIFFFVLNHEIKLFKAGFVRFSPPIYVAQVPMQMFLFKFTMSRETDQKKSPSITSQITLRKGRLIDSPSLYHKKWRNCTKSEFGMIAHARFLAGI